MKEIIVSSAVPNFLMCLLASLLASYQFYLDAGAGWLTLSATAISLRELFHYRREMKNLCTS